jgi:hypothetical protein
MLRMRHSSSSAVIVPVQEYQPFVLLLLYSIIDLLYLLCSSIHSGIARSASSAMSDPE